VFVGGMEEASCLRLHAQQVEIVAGDFIPMLITVFCQLSFA
jgi:hypothetical protein